MTSIAVALPTARVSRCVPPAPGMTPILISGWPIFAVSDAITTSQSIMSSQPPPRAKPLTAATIGFLVRLIRSHVANWSRVYISSIVRSAMSPISAPAAHARSLPASTMTMMESSRSNASICSASCVMSSGFSALSTFGRFRRTMPTGPSVSARISCSSAMGFVSTVVIGVLFQSGPRACAWAAPAGPAAPGPRGGRHHTRSGRRRPWCRSPRSQWP